jgi:uncharacterized protein (TIGR00369 family)
MSDAADIACRADRNARFIQRFMDGVPHLKTLGIVYRAHGDDWAELTLPYAASLIVDDGVIASGAIFSLMDSAAGFAVFTTLKSMTGHATLDLRLDYLHGPAPGVAIVGRAICYKVTSSIAFVRGFAHQGDPDRPLANMAGTFVHGGAA